MLNDGYHFPDLVPKGRDEADLSPPQSWVRYRDRYMIRNKRKREPVTCAGSAAAEHEFQGNVAWVLVVELLELEPTGGAGFGPC